MRFDAAPTTLRILICGETWAGVTKVRRPCWDHQAGRLVVCASGYLGAGADFLIFVLQLIEPVINAALGEQLLVGTHFANLAFVHHDDLIGALDSGEPVSDDYRSAAFDHAA